MPHETLTFRSPMPVPAAELFRWHARPGAFARLGPPWETVDLVFSDGSIRDGARTIVRVPFLGPLRKTWIAEHFGHVEGEQFCDRQVSGPFASFEHTHRMLPDGPTRSILEDRLEYRVPLGGLGRLLGGGLVRRKLDAMFAYRHRVTAADLRRHAEYADRPRLKVLVTGGNGVVGRQLIPFLTTGGHTVAQLVRPQSPAPAAGDGTQRIPWNPAGGKLDAAHLEGFDAVVHLAGEGIATGRWTAAKKARILQSRVGPTKLLSETLAKLARPPRVFLSASAVGYYGDRGASALTEEAVPGCGFLPKVCREWEAATAPAAAAGLRTVLLRIGVVLTPSGGALAAQLPLFRWGLGAKLGSGSQHLSWIGLDDLLYAIHFGLMEEKLAGPVNIVAPQATTNATFTQALGQALRRPAFLRAPAWAATALLGEMAPALLLASLRAMPTKLTHAGFRFEHPDLPTALGHLLGHPPPNPR